MAKKQARKSRSTFNKAVYRQTSKNELGERANPGYFFNKQIETKDEKDSERSKSQSNLADRIGSLRQRRDSNKLSNYYQNKRFMKNPSNANASRSASTIQSNKSSKYLTSAEA